MKLEYMSFYPDKYAPEGNRNRASLIFDEKTKIDVAQFLSPETMAAIERDAQVAAANSLNLTAQD